MSYCWRSRSTSTGEQGHAEVATKHTNSGATTGCEAELWAMADTLRSSVVDEDCVANPADRGAA